LALGGSVDEAIKNAKAVSGAIKATLS